MIMNNRCSHLSYNHQLQCQLVAPALLWLLLHISNSNLKLTSCPNKLCMEKTDYWLPPLQCKTIPHLLTHRFHWGLSTLVGCTVGQIPWSRCSKRLALTSNTSKSSQFSGLVWRTLWVSSHAYPGFLDQERIPKSKLWLSCANSVSPMPTTPLMIGCRLAKSIWLLKHSKTAWRSMVKSITGVPMIKASTELKKWLSSEMASSTSTWKCVSNSWVFKVALRSSLLANSLL